MELVRRSATEVNFVLLRHLLSYPGVSKTDLAKCAAINGSQARRFVAFLEMAGAIACVDSGYYITKKGRGAVRHLGEYYRRLGITVPGPRPPPPPPPPDLLSAIQALSLSNP